MTTSTTPLRDRALHELRQFNIQVLQNDQDIEYSPSVDGWYGRALHTFRSEVGHRNYPCHFGRLALKRNELFVTPVELPDVAPLGHALQAFLDYSQPTPERRQVLAAFVRTQPTHTHRDHADTFWTILQQLHDNDTAPWPADQSTDPNDPSWEFCFHGVPMFVFSAMPTHFLRRSRNLGDHLVLLFQPRNVFVGIEGGTPAGTAARRGIRTRLSAWDIAAPHPSMGDFGDPSNREWEQYVIPDDAAAMHPTCPFTPTTARSRS